VEATKSPGVRADMGQPLEGEDLATLYLDDAAHWITVYSELASGAARADLTTRLGQFRARLTFWQRRHKELRDHSA